MSRPKLDIAANIAIIVVCIVACTVLIRNQFFPPAPPPPPGSVQEGESLPALGAVVPAGADKALVMAVSPQCHFCNESLPFYKQLGDKPSRNVKLVAAVPSPEMRDQELKAFTDSGVKTDAVVPIDFRSAKVQGTPTLMLVNRGGKVLKVWVGKLEAREQQEVIATL